MAWVTLAELVTHLGLNTRLVNALEVQFGTFNDRISAVAFIPEHLWRTECARARYLAHAAVVAVAAGPGVAAVVGQPAVWRNLTAVESAQSGMIWRIANRIAWVNSGKAWADYPDFDVMPDVALRTAGFAPGAVGPQPHVANVGTATKYKQSQVTDQGDDSEFTAATRAEVDTWSANYFQQEQVHPG